MSANTMHYKGYVASIEYDAEDECLIGHVLGITDRLVFHGDSIPTIRKNFHNVLDNYLSLCEKTGKEPEMPKSGKLLVRLPAELHAHISRRSKASGESVNSIVIDAIQSYCETDGNEKKKNRRRITGIKTKKARI